MLELLALQPSEADQIGTTGVVEGLDASRSMLEIAQSRAAAYPHVRLRAGDVTELPFPDDAFNAAVCTQVYEFVDDVPRALHELKRVLRPHPHLPRELGPLLRHAGFGTVLTKVIPIVNAGFTTDSYSAGVIDLIAGHARPRIGEATVDAWVRAKHA